MANRHCNKQLRLGVRRRMAATGESYQQALSALQRSEPQRSEPRRSEPRRGDRAAEPARDEALDGRTPSAEVDLLVARYFGLPIVLAVFEAEQPVGRPVILRVPAAALGHAGLHMPVPFFNFRQDGRQ